MELIEEAIVMTERPYQLGQSDNRPWGMWRVVEAQKTFAVKTISVKPGERLSLQYHQHRSELWIIVQGRGLVTLGGDTIRVERGRHIYVPRETRHRIENDGQVELRFVEVQYGERLDESDIIRLDDDYCRVTR